MQHTTSITIFTPERKGLKDTVTYTEDKMSEWNGRVKSINIDDNIPEIVFEQEFRIRYVNMPYILEIKPIKDENN